MICDPGVQYLNTITVLIIQISGSDYSLFWNLVFRIEFSIEEEIYDYELLNIIYLKK